MARKITERPPNVTDKELAEFDEEFIADTFGPLSKADRERWERVRRGGAVSVSIDARLLKRVDALAKKKRISRERLIESSIEAMLAGNKKEHRAKILPS